MTYINIQKVCEKESKMPKTSKYNKGVDFAKNNNFRVDGTILLI